MATADSVKTNLQNIIAKANTATGRADSNVDDAVDALVGGYGQGGGITPSGTINITENGEHDVTNYASALVNVPTGMNAKVFKTTVSSDITSGNYTIFSANDFLKSIRSNSNAFVLLVPLNQSASTAAYSLWLIANFTLAYTGATQRKGIVIRTTATANNVTGSNYGLPGANGSGHLSVESDGSLMIRGCNTTYPVRAGEYLIIAGIAEML